MVRVDIKKQVIEKSSPLITKKPVLQTNQTEKILVENFIGLQKVMVDLAEKFTDLSTQMSKLLGLFETSAKTLAEKGFEDNKEIVQKINSLLDQNKILAKGIFLLHEAEEELEEDVSQIPTTQRPPMQAQQRQPMQAQQRQPMQAQQRQPMPPQRPPMQAQQPEQGQKKEPINMQEYQKSISSP